MKKTRFLLSLLLTAALLTGCERENPVQKAAVPTTGATEAATVPTTGATEAAAIPFETAPPETEPQPEIFTLTFVGDCTLGATPDNYGADMGFVKVVGQDYDYPFRNVLDFFSKG